MEKPARPKTALNECVKVVVRCRPLNGKEQAEGHDEIVDHPPPPPKWFERLSSPNKSIKPERPTLNAALKQVVKVSSERGAVHVLNPHGQDKLFTYDAAYGPDANTQAIYDEMVRPLVSSVLDGFNGCVFAYGQTGTGKTHTMGGGGGTHGIIPTAFQHVWQHIESAAADVTHLVSCSYVELYLEEVRDLLNKDNKKLLIRGQELNGFYIPEMTSVVCRSAKDMQRVLTAGDAARARGRTDMNEHSSRSHAVFLVTIESQHKPTNRIRVGKLNLVDLAGSERQRKSGAAGERLKEAARINQALSSLGNVISALAENSPHVPYRDSKLTRILQDSLGGNSKTIMIATVGPAAYNYDETLTTLRYAHRAKAIKNKPVRNEDPKDAKLREYQAEIERLRALIEARKANANVPVKEKERPKRTPKVKENGVPEGDEDIIDTANIESEQAQALEAMEAARDDTQRLEAAIQTLEQRLVAGGGAGAGAGRALVDSLNRAQAELAKRTTEIAERKKREVEMTQRIELEEETTANVSQTFATLQQEVDHKTQRLKKCLSRYAALREEAVELREAHDRERRDGEERQAALGGALRRRLLLADSFIPAAGRQLAQRLTYNEDNDQWEVITSNGASPLSVRPSASGQRRPMCVLAVTSSEPRRRADNLLDLMPLSLPPTVRHRPPPAPSVVTPPAVETPMSTSVRSLDGATKMSTSVRSLDGATKMSTSVRSLDGAARRQSARRPRTAHHRPGTAGVR